MTGHDGEYDFATYSVALAALANPFVIRHEQEHNDFTRRTIFGLCQSLLEHLGEINVTDDTVFFKARMHKASVTAHEAGATYCAIKALPDNARPGMVSALDPTYTRLYELLASVIDPHVGSSYAQYAFGKAIVGCALDPPFSHWLQSIVATELRHSTVPESIAPNARLQRILTMVDAAGVAGWSSRVRGAFAEVVAQQPDGRDAGPHLFDRDDGWSELETFAAQHLSSRLVELARDDLEVVLDADVDLVRHVDFDGEQERVVAELRRLSGASIPIRRLRAPSDLHVDPALALADLSAVVRTGGGWRGPPESDLSRAEIVSSWLASEGDHYALALPGPPTSTTEHWALAVVNGTSVTAYRSDDPSFRAHLAARHELAVRGGRATSLSGIVTHAADWQAFKHHYADLGMYLVRRSSGVLQPDYETGLIAWYMGGDLRQWWSRFRAAGDPRIGIIGAFPTSEPSSTEPTIWNARQPGAIDAHLTVREAEATRSATPSLTGILIRADALIGTFVRFFPTSVLAHLPWLTDGKLHSLTAEELAGIRPHAERLEGLLTQLWGAL